MKSSRQIFKLQSSTIQPLKANKRSEKRTLWKESKPRTLVVSDSLDVFMSGCIVVNMFNSLHKSTLLFSLFPIFTKKKIIKK